MTPVVARKIRDLVKAGASVVGPKPLASPSLQDYPACDTDVKQIAGELWEGGNVISEKPVAQVLADMKVQPDFQTGATNMVWIHRRIETADVYFVSNQADTGRVVECTFRVAGMQPELWDAATGETHEARTFTSEGGLTKLPVKFDPRGSVFVVFRKPAAGAKGENNWSEFTPVQDVTGAWQVRFDPRWGGPGQVTFDQLTDWTKRAEAGIRYYSGTAVYTKEFDLAKALGNARLFLDLGTVKNLAEVRVNGQSVGIAWKQPFRVEVTKAVKQGANTLEVRVVNLWPNRFIGDEQEPDDCVRDKYGALKEIPSWLTEGKPRPSAGRYTFLVYKPYNKTERLLESGLLGPVRIVCEAGH
jgi:hypothetical protein